MILYHINWINTLRACCLLMALSLCSCLEAQQTVSVTTGDLSQAMGAWAGQLIYKDYRSGKQIPIPATLQVTRGSDFLFIWEYDYPKEPGKGNKDSLEIRENGRMINKMTVREKALGTNGSLRIILEERGTDGNDSKPATFQRIIESRSDSLIITKLVRLDGEPAFFQRNQYQFIRQK